MKRGIRRELIMGCGLLAAFALFEAVVVNRRPVLIDGYPEASSPSSTTMLVMCVMPTAAMQLRSRMPSRAPRRIVTAAIALFTAFRVPGRLLSGVRWLTDMHWSAPASRCCTAPQWAAGGGDGGMPTALRHAERREQAQRPARDSSLRS